MTGIIFGIIIPLFLNGTSDVQNIIDSKGGIWLGGTGCEDTKWIASHNRDIIGKNINNIKKGKEVKISQCKYLVEDILIVSK
ncbi:MAG TPA: hypothetical protein PLW93_01380, partial [Candidatus Absconditabacterales bacterium]|nr:hypothetical protein [Candidatus Absconditabacterales bacterium]